MPFYFFRIVGSASLSLVFTSDASTSASTAILISPWKRARLRHKHRQKHKHKVQNLSFFSCACAYACVCPATSENEIPLRHNTSTRIFTTHEYVWPVKTLDPDYLAPKQLGNVRMILLVLVFASNFVVTWAIPVARVRAFLSSENQATGSTRPCWVGRQL